MIRVGSGRVRGIQGSVTMSRVLPRRRRCKALLPGLEGVIALREHLLTCCQRVTLSLKQLFLGAHVGHKHFMLGAEESSMPNVSKGGMRSDTCVKRDLCTDGGNVDFNYYDCRIFL